MTLRYLALALSIGCMCACSSAKKAQTTDDVYYSDGGKAQNDYVANDGTDDRIQPTSTADNYNQYAYGSDYAPYDTYASPFYGPSMYSPWYNPWNPYYGTGFGFGLGYGFGWSSIYSAYPGYYGGYYNPYYPGFGYYTHPYVGTVFPYAPQRVNVMAYNNSHFNNINTTVATQGGIHLNKPTLNTVSGRAPLSLTTNKVVASQWQPYRVASDSRVNNLSRQRQSNFRPNNQNTRQPAFNNNSGSSRFGSGGFGGGARMGGGGFGRGGRG